MNVYRVENIDGTAEEIEAEHCEEDGDLLVANNWHPKGADPIAPHTEKVVVKSWQRADIVSWQRIR